MTNHLMAISGSKASCACGAWEATTNETGDAATSTLCRQYQAHIFKPALKPRLRKATKAYLLAAAAEAQAKYWEAVRDLEAALDIELDGEDLSAVADVTELRKMVKRRSYLRARAETAIAQDEGLSFGGRRRGAGH